MLVPINVCCAQLVPIVVCLSSYDAGKAEVKLEIARVWRLLWSTPLGKNKCPLRYVYMLLVFALTQAKVCD